MHELVGIITASEFGPNLAKYILKYQDFDP